MDVFILQLLLGVFLVSAGAEQPPAICTIIINELQLSAPNVTEEFIELTLSTSCPTPFDLTPYTLVLWRSHKDITKMDLRSMARFSTKSSCNSTLTKQSLVIGSVPLQHTDAQFCSFSDFGKDWEKSQQNAGYIDKGNEKTNALVLYKNADAEKLKVEISMLNADTAQRDKIVDVVFFARKGSAGEEIRKLLFPEYDVRSNDSTDKTIYFRLSEEDAGNVMLQDKHSFSFCCNQNEVAGKWPMGFKYSKPTPGLTNNCSSSYKYSLDGDNQIFNASLDRCDVMNFYNKTEKELRSDDGSGLGLGIGLGIGIPVFAALVLVPMILIHKKKRRSRRNFQNNVVI